MAAPNLVLIVLDAFRYDHFRRETPRGPLCPNLLRLAERAVCFDDAISPAGYTVATHASFFTGKLPCEHGVLSQRPLPAPTMGADSLLPLLRRAGYTCLGVSDNPYFDKANVLGADFDVLISTRRAVEERERRLRDEYRAAVAGERFHLLAALGRRLGLKPREPTPAPARHQMMVPALESLLRSLPDATRKGPVFLYCNLMGAHEPYSADPEDVEFSRPEGGPAKLVRPESFHAVRRHCALGVRQLSPSLISALEWSYAAAVRCTDRILESVVRIVEQNLDSSRTDIIVTADHGEMLGEHGELGHGLRLYGGLVHVPLLLISPAAGAPRRVADIVQNHWLWSWFLERAGVAGSVDSPAGQEALCGEPLPDRVALSFSGPEMGWEWLQTALSVALRDGVEPSAIRAVSLDPQVQAVRSPDAALIVSRSGSRTVWRRTADRGEQQLTGPDAAEAGKRLSEHLVSDIAARPQAGSYAGPDEGVMDRLRDLGYVD